MFRLLIFLSFLSTSVFGQTSDIQTVFSNKKDGYRKFRIPVIISNKSGKLFAFCEGRKSLWDDGDIDLVMKTSDDFGKNWSALKVIWDDGHNTCGNPVPIYDEINQQILLVASLNNDNVFLLSADSTGQNWDMPLNITHQVKKDNWQWYATGPVHGVMLQNEQFPHRIVIPCNHTLLSDKRHWSHVIFSDDFGNTWQIGENAGSPDTDECTVAALKNGDLLLNMRTNNNPYACRKIAFSKDGGSTWSTPENISQLSEPGCQGALLSFPEINEYVYFINPKHPKKRKNLTLSISTNNGQNWSGQITVHGRKSAYSDMVLLENGDLLIVFETGCLLPYGGIFTKTISAAELSKW